MTLIISHGITTAIVETAFAQETAEERAHEENKNALTSIELML